MLDLDTHLVSGTPGRHLYDVLIRYSEITWFGDSKPLLNGDYGLDWIGLIINVSDTVGTGTRRTTRGGLVN